MHPIATYQDGNALSAAADDSSSPSTMPRPMMLLHSTRAAPEGRAQATDKVLGCLRAPRCPLVMGSDLHEATPESAGCTPPGGAPTPDNNSKRL
jgi:hypothetical protein